jgi:hypothetical protein
MVRDSRATDQNTVKTIYTTPRDVTVTRFSVLGLH